MIWSLFIVLLLLFVCQFSHSRYLSSKSLPLTRKFDEIESLYFFDKLFLSNLTENDNQKQQRARTLLSICDLDEGKSILLNHVECELLSNLSKEDTITLQKYLQIKCEERQEKQNEEGTTNIKYHVIKLKRTRNPAFRRLFIEKRLKATSTSSSSSLLLSKHINHPHSNSNNIINNIISKTKIQDSSSPSETSIIISEYLLQKDQRIEALKPIDEQIFDLYLSKYRPFKTIKMKIYNKNNQLVLHDPIEVSVMSSVTLLVEELLRLEVSSPCLFSTSFSNSKTSRSSSNNNGNLVCRILKSLRFVDVQDFNMSFLRCGVIPPSGIQIQLFYVE